MTFVRALCVMLCLLPTWLYAQTKYIDDTLYLGFYNEPDGSGEQFSSAPSGTKLTLIEERGAYSLVRSEKGTEGWVKSKYLVDSAPAIVRIKVLEEISKRADELALIVDSLNAENGDLREEVDTLQSRLDNQEEQLKLAESASSDRATMNESIAVASLAVDQEQIAALNNATAEALAALAKFTNTAQKVEVPVATEFTEQVDTDAVPALDSRALLKVFSKDGETTMAWDYIVVQLKSINIIHYALIAAAAILGFLLGVFFLDRRIRSQHGGYRIW